MIVADLSPAQQELRDNARAFAQATLGQDHTERDRRGALDESDWRADWNACAEYGVLKLNLPVEYGGQGLDLVSTVAALEGLGQGSPDHGLSIGLNGQMWAVMEPIASFGSDAQKAKYLPPLSDGRMIGSHGLTEPETGSDAMSLKTRAERVDGGYRLNGEKTYVGMAPAADVAVVFASTKPENRQWGISAFLVEAGDVGFNRDAPQAKMGLRTMPMGALHFEDCIIPEDRLLGQEGAGMSIFQHTMIWERSFIFSAHVGAMERQLKNAVEFARTRRVFGKPVIDNQSVSNRLADMKLRLESARMMLYRAAWLMDQGTSSALEAAMVKLHISEAFLASSLDAARIHGGKGYLEGMGVEHEMRDAFGGVIYSGTSDIQRQIISALL